MVAAIAAAVLVVAVAVDAAVMWARPRRLDVVPGGSARGGSTLLLVGTDSRAGVRAPGDDRRYGTAADNPGERADVVLLVRTDTAGGVRMLEVPRDLLVVGRKGAPVRLTTTLLDGPSGLTDSLCRSLGLGVDRVAEVRFPGLRSMVDAVGGVEVTVDRPLRDTYTKFHLGSGRHLLSGDDALAYVGARHVEVQEQDGRWVPDAASVGNRSSKGADVLRALGRRAAPSRWHPLAAQRSAWAATGAVAVDRAVSPTDVPSLLGTVARLPSVATTHLPVTTRDGVIPVARLAPGAGAVLATFEGTSSPARACRPLLPEARRP